MISAVAMIWIPPSTMNTPAWIATARAVIKTEVCHGGFPGQPGEAGRERRAGQGHRADELLHRPPAPGRLMDGAKSSTDGRVAQHCQPSAARWCLLFGPDPDEQHLPKPSQHDLRAGPPHGRFAGAEGHDVGEAWRQAALLAGNVNDRGQAPEQGWLPGLWKWNAPPGITIPGPPPAAGRRGTPGPGDSPGARPGSAASPARRRSRARAREHPGPCPGLRAPPPRCWCACGRR